jgi:hypothetical protein
MGIWSCCSAGDIIGHTMSVPRLLWLCADVAAFNLCCRNLWPQFFREVKVAWRLPLRSQHSVECGRFLWTTRWGGGRRGPRHKNMPAPISIPTPFRHMSCFTQAYVHTIPNPTRPPVTDRKKTFQVLMWNKQMENFGRERWNKHKPTRYINPYTDDCQKYLH